MRLELVVETGPAQPCLDQHLFIFILSNVCGGIPGLVFLMLR